MIVLMWGEPEQVAPWPRRGTKGTHDILTSSKHQLLLADDSRMEGNGNGDGWRGEGYIGKEDKFSRG